VWSAHERKLVIIILPPPWRTWWAYTGYGFLVLGALYAGRRNLLQRERLKSTLKLEQVAREKEHFELEKAQEVDRVKTSFFTNISHEFRTPLTLIKGPVDVLLDKFKDDPDVRARLKMVQQNSDLLLKLINQLLDLAKLESGTLKIEKTQGDLYSFVRAIASSFSSFAAQKNISVNVNVPGDPCLALFDRDKLETILINLINNAIKFTPNGGKVHVNAEVANDHLSLSVEDTGIGIPEEHQSKIFERFHQVSESHKEVGTGIGLALVRELVVLLGGNISLKSKPGAGSAFMLDLPVEVAAETEVESIAEAKLSFTDNQAVSNNGQNIRQPSIKDRADDTYSTLPHILVVEDNADVRAFIIDSLGGEFHFSGAENGMQGLEIAIRDIPDLIISDVMMPVMDGITMATKIKSDIHTSHIPLILLTAKSTEDSKLTGLQSGADDYLTKPFNKNELLLIDEHGSKSGSAICR
jgi:signal transduction histidine kinase/CheY-like chemotaxis protein